MKAIEIRNKYLNFFKNHGHVVIPSAPLIPENDPSVLFTTAGMLEAAVAEAVEAVRQLETAVWESQFKTKEPTETEVRDNDHK
jgi:alanyl-tRNA synthetase